MSKKRPSRSEIESALAGRTASKKRVTKPLKVPTEQTHNRRRQKMLGGNISGVSTKPKNSPNLLTWVIGILTVLIIAALLIPEPDDRNKQHQESMEAIKKVDKIYTESRIKEIEETDISNVDSEGLFTRSNDLERAKQYREEEEKEKKLATMFERAEALMAKERFSKPANDNAYAVYKEILEFDNGNFKAQQGIDKIQEYYIGKIEAGIESDNFKPAKRALESLKTVTEDEDLITEYQEAINQKEQANLLAQKQAEIDEILAKASTAYRKGNKLSPAKKNALYYYRQVLEVNKNDEQATKGVEQIANDYLELANNAVIKEEYEAAKGYLTTVQAINPEHPSIPLLEKQITEKQIAEQEKAKQQEAEQVTEAVTENTETPQPETTATEETSDEQVSEAVIDEQPPTETQSAQARKQADIDTLNLREGLAAYYLGDYEKSLSLLQPLADKGISRAQFRIGYMYRLGRGVPTNVNKADNIIRSALPAIQKFANEGRAWAQSDLASLYDDGLVLPKDALKAISWYEKAAYQGYAGAQTNLGLMYYYGKGVRTNRELAIEWFKRAAKQGDVTAKKNLEALGIEAN